jgi:hypothetical protein
MKEKKKNFIQSNSTLIIFVLGIIIGSIGTSMSNNNNHIENMNEVGDNHATHDHSMDHPTLEVDSLNAPSISIEVIKDLKSGWMLKLNTPNFIFAPENANLDNLDNQGHAHLYIDGEKITRLYSNYYYIGDLTNGEHEIKVSLNANDHSQLTLNGVNIEDSKIIIQE